MRVHRFAALFRLPLLLLLTTCVSDPSTNAPRPAANTIWQIQASFVPNLLSDPGFDLDGSGWQNVSAPGRALDSVRFHVGVASERISGSALQEYAVYQDVSVTAESAYAVTGWVATDGLDQANAVLEILWLQSAGLGDSIPANELIGSAELGRRSGTADWTSLGGQVTAPAAAVVARFQLRLEVEPDDLGTAWFDTDSLAAAQPPDRTPPTVAITAPAPGDTLTTPTMIVADASDDGLVSQVSFSANGFALGPPATASPYQVQLNTDTLPIGPVDLVATATDTAGNSATSTPVRVIVVHPDTTPPLVEITAPIAGSTVSGSITISAHAMDEGLVAGVQFTLNGANLGSEVTASPYDISLDTRTLPNAPADLSAVARDTAGNTGAAAVVQVIVDNPPPPPRYNIILILTDDQRPATMAQMPLTMSLLGTPGVQFTNAFATTPLCCPSRASILTGQFTHNHHVLSNIAPWGAPVFSDQSTIATWMQSAGYRTGMVGKYLNLYDQLQPWPYQPPGWNYWAVFKQPKYASYKLVENGLEVSYGTSAAHYSTKLLATKAIGFINSTPATQPFFLIYAPYAPHQPATPATADKTLFSTLPKWRPPSFNELDVSDKPQWVRNLPRLTTAQISANDKFRLDQLRSLQSVDRAVRDIVNALIAAGRMATTAIIFTSDNGMSWGEHRWTAKNCLYEECIRVPFLALVPGVAPRMESNLIALTDLAPTFATWAGALPQQAVNGVSLDRLLTSPGTPWRQELLIEVLGPGDITSPEGLFSGVRTQRYAYAEYTSGELELYDLQTDPYQLTNVASDPANAALIAQLSTLVATLKSN